MVNEIPVKSNSSKKTGIFYGYIVLAACFFIMVLVYGSQYCFGVFFKPMIADFGWSRAETSVAFSLYMFVSGLLGIMAGRLSDRLGARRVVTFGSILLGTGYMLASRTENIWQLYLFYGLIIAAGSSTMYVPIVSMITRWFPRNTGFMAGVGISGIGLGIGVVPLIASRLIVVLDWRPALFVVGAAGLIVIAILAQLLKRPEVGGEAGTGENVYAEKPVGFSLKEAILTRQFWMFFVGWVCYGFFYQVGLVHIVPYATDIGLSATAAAAVLTVIGLVGTPARVGLGISGDRFTNRFTLMTSFAVMALVYAGLTASSSVAMLYVFAVIFGALNGVGILLAPIIAEYFGYKSLGAIVGAIIFANNLGSAISPTLAGEIFDTTGSYRLAFLSCALLGALAAFILWRLKSTNKDFQ